MVKELLLPVYALCGMLHLGVSGCYGNMSKNNCKTMLIFGLL